MVLSITIVDGSRYTGDRKGAITEHHAEDMVYNIYSEGVSDISTLPKTGFFSLLRGL